MYEDHDTSFTWTKDNFNTLNPTIPKNPSFINKWSLDKTNRLYFSQICEDCGWVLELVFEIKKEKDSWNLVACDIKNM